MKIPRRNGEESSATIAQAVVLAFGCLMLGALTALGAPPAWWSSPGTGSQPAVRSPQVVTNNGVVTTNYVPNDYAAVTQGQLKQFTVRAVDYLNTNLTGGAGTNLNGLVQGWAQDYATNGYNATNLKPTDYAAMNVGQLKFVGNQVWSRLVSAGYVSSVPTWLAFNTNTDHAVANLGQLKQVFNFDTHVAPRPVTGLTATPGANEIDLNWFNPPGNPVTSITIVQTASDGTTRTFTLGPGATSFAANTLNSNLTYTFSVTTSNQTSGSSSATSTGSTHPQPSASMPPVPTGITGTIDLSHSTMNLSWTPSAGASGYQVDRQTLATGVWQSLGPANGTSYADSNYGNGGYHYRVSASNSMGTSAASADFPSTRYAVIDLGANTHPKSINNNGDVVGNQAAGPFFWHSGLSHILTTTGVGAAALGLNDNGQIVGWQWKLIAFDDSYGNVFPRGIGAVWTSSTASPADLAYIAGVAPAPGYSFSFAVQISNGGQIFGENFFPGAPYAYSAGFAGYWPNSSSSPVLLTPLPAQVEMLSDVDFNGARFGAANRSGLVVRDAFGLHFSKFPVYCISDNTNPSYGGITVDAPHGFILDGSVFYDLGQVSPVTFSTASDQLQLLAYYNYQHIYQLLYTKNLTSAQAVWNSNPTNVNDLLPVGLGWNLQTIDVSSNPSSQYLINNSGAIISEANYTGSDPAIAQGPHGVMLLPMQLTSKDRMITGSIKLPDSWTGISLHFINNTTGQDLGTFANVVENMTAATPAFKIYNTKEDMFSDTESQQDLAGSLDPMVTSQKVVFYKDDNDPKLLHFATTFDDVGDVRVEIIKNGSVMGYNGVHLTADADFSSVIGEVDNRITTPLPAPVVDPNDPNDPNGSGGSGLGLLVAQEPGSMNFPGTIDSNKSSAAALVLPLHSGTALPTGSDSDLSLITLRQPTGLTSNAGTVTLTVSAPSSVALFNQAATHVLANYSVNLAAPAGDLAALATGNAQVWIRGAATNSNVTLTYTYTDANGTVQQTDTVHLSVSTSGAMIWPGTMRDMPMFCGGGIRGPPGVAMSLMSMKVWSSVGQTAPIPPSKIKNDGLTTKVMLALFDVVTDPLTAQYWRGVIDGLGGAAYADLNTLGNIVILSAMANDPSGLGQLYINHEIYATANSYFQAINELRKLTPAQRDQILDTLVISAGLHVAGAVFQWQSLTPGQQQADIEYAHGYVSGYLFEQAVVCLATAGGAEALKGAITAAEAGQLALNVPKALQVVDTALTVGAEADPASVALVKDALEKAAAEASGSATVGDTIANKLASLDATNGKDTLTAFTKYVAEYAKGAQWSKAGKDAFVKLADLLTKLGTDASADSVKGFGRFYGSMIDATGLDHYADLLAYFTDSGTLNTSELKSFLEMFSDSSSSYFTRDVTANTWTSKTSQLVYGTDATYGNRVMHVLHHVVAGGPGDSVFKVEPRGQVFQLIDEAYALRGSGTATSQGARTKYVVPMGRVIGIASPNNGGGPASNVVIIIDNATDTVITSWCQ